MYSGRYIHIHLSYLSTKLNAFQLHIELYIGYASVRCEQKHLQRLSETVPANNFKSFLFVKNFCENFDKKTAKFATYTYVIWIIKAYKCTSHLHAL